MIVYSIADRSRPKKRVILRSLLKRRRAGDSPLTEQGDARISSRQTDAENPGVNLRDLGLLSQESSMCSRASQTENTTAEAPRTPRKTQSLCVSAVRGIFTGGINETTE